MSGAPPLPLAERWPGVPGADKAALARGRLGSAAAQAVRCERSAAPRRTPALPCPSLPFPEPAGPRTRPRCAAGGERGGPEPLLCRGAALGSLWGGISPCLGFPAEVDSPGCPAAVGSWRV